MKAQPVNPEFHHVPEIIGLRNEALGLYDLGGEDSLGGWDSFMAPDNSVHITRPMDHWFKQPARELVIDPGSDTESTIAVEAITRRLTETGYTEDEWTYKLDPHSSIVPRHHLQLMYRKCVFERKYSPDGMIDKGVKLMVGSELSELSELFGYVCSLAIASELEVGGKSTEHHDSTPKVRRHHRIVPHFR